MIIISLTTLLNHSKSLIVVFMDRMPPFFNECKKLLKSVNPTEYYHFQKRKVWEFHPYSPWVNIFLLSHIHWIYSVNMVTKFTEYIHYQVNDIWLIILPRRCLVSKSQSASLWMRITKEITWHNVVNFEATYDGHQKPLKCSFNIFCVNFDVFHLWPQNLHYYVWTPLCLVYFCEPHP